MVERICPNCGKAYQLGDEVCRFCGYVFPFSTVELSRGTVLHGRYEVQELIHTGGMGYVYLARDKTLFDRPCIVKQIREPIKSEEHRRKLEEEALRMASLNNPNIAMILDHFIENGRYFLIVERIRGKTLLEVFRERQSLMKEEEVVRWAIGICDVIAYIHQEGVIHRDISPDNIMMTDEGAIKFIDFGTLREFRYVVTGGTAGMGKYGYTPPEQWQGKPEPRSDIFALGATIYYLLTGFLPLSKEVTTGQPPQREDFYPRFPPIRMNNPKVSPQLEVILQKALQLDVANRFASAVEIRQALKNLEPVTQPVARIPGKKINFKSRRTLAFMSVTVACLIGVVLFLTLRGESSNTVQIPAHAPKIFSSSQTTDTPLARETAASQYATTSPDIDGVLVPGEWPDTGFSKSFKYTVDDVSKDGGVTTVYFMNDSSELYVAINISAPDFKEQMYEKNDFWFQAYITYDGNSDGVIKPGERFRGFEKTSWDSGKMSIGEAKFKTVYLSDDGYLTTSYNTATYGMGVAGYSSTTHSYIYECSIPLNSGSEGDLAAKPGDSISINIIIYQYFRYNDSYTRYSGTGWPGSGGVIDIDNYAKLVLAAASGTSPQESASTIETPQLKWNYYAGDTEICPPVIGPDGTIYSNYVISGEYTNFLYAVNPNGSLKWKQDLNMTPAGIAVAPDGTIFTSCYTSLYAFNPDGSKKWTYSTDYPVTAPSIAVDGIVYITSSQRYTSDDSYLLAVKSDGSLDWKYKISNSLAFAPIISSDGVIYVCSINYNDTKCWLLAIGHSGSLKWRQEIRYSSYQALATGADGKVYLSNIEGVKAFNADGSLAWSQQFYCSYSSLCIGPDSSIYVYVMPNQYIDKNSNENLYCISKTGSLMWKRDLGAFEYNDRTSFNRYPAPAVGPDGTVYIGSLNDELFAFGPDGSLKWNIALKTTADVPPADSDSDWQVVYGPTSPVIGIDGTIYIGAAKMLHAIGVTVSIDTSSPGVQQ